mmetsp:Transcript_9157/g.14881  ORF Transcript_9157/g.14881 Transcript_9157/m.14881 type:complete len:92 (+) Transcript_9157:1259-1534(+)
MASWAYCETLNLPMRSMTALTNAMRISCTPNVVESLGVGMFALLSYVITVFGERLNGERMVLWMCLRDVGEVTVLLRRAGEFMTYRLSSSK